MIDARAMLAVVAALLSALLRRLLGAALALIGSLGLLRLPTFYERVHAPTMGTTLGTGFILIASMLLFSALESRPVLHEILIARLHDRQHPSDLHAAGARGAPPRPAPRAAIPPAEKNRSADVWLGDP